MLLCLWCCSVGGKGSSYPRWSPCHFGIINVNVAFVGGGVVVVSLYGLWLWLQGGSLDQKKPTHKRAGKNYVEGCGGILNRHLNRPNCETRMQQ